MDGVKTHLKSFSEETTIHGLKKLVSAKCWLWRLFWACACIAATVVFITQFGNLIHKYRSNPTRTVIEVKREPIEFPDITICPLRNLDVSIIESLFYLSIDRTTGARSTRHPNDILKDNDTRLDNHLSKNTTPSSHNIITFTKITSEVTVAFLVKLCHGQISFQIYHMPYYRRLRFQYGKCCCSASGEDYLVIVNVPIHSSIPIS